MDDAHKQMMFEANRKSVGVAYLLWLVLGFVGVHRFYAGATKSGVAQLVLALSIIGWLVLIPWLLIDLALIPGLVRDQNMKTITMLGYSPQQAAPQVEGRPRPKTQADRKRDAMVEELRSIGHRKSHR
ncbi:TM2 domain-containing protein [Parerythrobacter aestuarii]|uniref:TM2 domain-containing protein n=1 Tax=Parerythrobacter aestuarii TaxID=3020909 RepID=UPI0024DE68FA|nr:TM2 domain-containing protein [Parerythrobacter aestuarii]